MVGEPFVAVRFESDLAGLWVDKRAALLFCVQLILHVASLAQSCLHEDYSQ
jgi:hypothetical protein